MNLEKKNYELIKFEDGDFSLDVSVSTDDNTIWLTQSEIALLFNVDRTRITRHINNIFDEFELERKSNVRKTHFPFSDKQVNIYNLDVILAVGYRVKSKRGILFRRWSSNILKEYLIKGYTINEKRCLSCATSIIELSSKVNSLEFELNDINNKIENIENILYSRDAELIFEGSILKPSVKIKSILSLAKEEIIIIDNYADKELLSLIDDINIKITIITRQSSELNNINLKPNITIINSSLYHDRFIIVDDFVYLIGTSFNGLGKKRFIMCYLNKVNKELILSDLKKNDK